MAKYWEVSVALEDSCFRTEIMAENQDEVIEKIISQGWLTKREFTFETILYPLHRVKHIKIMEM